jgi:hypothetical protein
MYDVLVYKMQWDQKKIIEYQFMNYYIKYEARHGPVLAY